jgi:NADPH2:quinone reductase
MKAAWYEKHGAARDVPTIGVMDEPQPRSGEVRIRIAFSGVNPGDVKKRQDALGVGMPYPRVIPHSDGVGTVDAVGEGVSGEWVVGVCGVTALRVIVLSERPPSTQWFL